jgi:hypothetical protein
MFYVLTLGRHEFMSCRPFLILKMAVDNILTCFENIVGLSNIECPCDTASDIEGSEISNSGLFVSDLVPLQLAGAASRCDENSAWKMLDNARREAVLYTFSDFSNKFLQRTNLKRPVYNGTIGDANGADWWKPTKSKIVYRVHCCPIECGVLRLKGLGLIGNYTGNVVLKVYDSLGVEKGSLTIAAQNNQHIKGSFTNALELPLKIEGASSTDYFIVIENLPPQYQVKKNKISCGCGGCYPSFNCNQVRFDDTGCNTPKSSWARWIQVGTYETDTLDFFNPINAMQAHGAGITLDCEIKCNLSDMLCKHPFDFENDAVSLSLAHAVNYKAAQKVIDKVLNSGDINRYTMLDGANLAARAADYENRYNVQMSYITSNIALDTCNCYDKKTPYKLYAQ